MLRPPSTDITLQNVTSIRVDDARRGDSLDGSPWFWRDFVFINAADGRATVSAFADDKKALPTVGGASTSLEASPVIIFALEIAERWLKSQDSAGTIYSAELAQIRVALAKARGEG